MMQQEASQVRPSAPNCWTKPGDLPRRPTAPRNGDGGECSQCQAQARADQTVRATLHSDHPLRLEGKVTVRPPFGLGSPPWSPPLTVQGSGLLVAGLGPRCSPARSRSLD